MSGEGKGWRAVMAGTERGGSLSDLGAWTDNGVVIELGIMGKERCPFFLALAAWRSS